MLTNNLKTISFFILIALLCAAPSFHKKLNKGKALIQSEGENARWLYTGKTRDVYDPLDNAYVVTDTLKEMILREKEMDFSKYKLLPVVSVWIDPADLHDEDRGILANPLKKGRLWERASYIYYYEKGEKKFESFAGVRVHGGESRKRPNKSLRLIFKKKYGAPSFPGPEGEAKSIVLRRDTIFNFANDFSYTMINEMGGLAPKLKHIAVYVNGEFYHYMHLVEHLNRDYVSKILGHKKFIFYKLKGNNDSADHLMYENLIHRVKGARKSISYSQMNELIDLENFTANLLMISYLSMNDWAQGVNFRDLIDPNGKWKLISWDFDFAFTSRTKGKNAWEIDGDEMIKATHRAGLRSQLFKRLMEETVEYPKYYLERKKEFCRRLQEIAPVKMKEYKALAQEFRPNGYALQSIGWMEEFVREKDCH